MAKAWLTHTATLQSLRRATFFIPGRREGVEAWPRIKKNQQSTIAGLTNQQLIEFMPAGL